ncbi:MAG: UDP-N-acetylmuramoyl-L-alanyl-D-glutamate--2,6-diaminopimelate ligase [Clostridia bacterium]|nr:UDP-N-acetylmuramoyl-L-alanyl-D-glutamate--2,6-diaminopimelate ligase [Clostridia bacterium]
MTFAELIEGLPILDQQGDLSVPIDTIVYDSRKARRGALFVCIEGYVTDGHLFALQAEQQSASAIILQKPVAGLKIPWVRVPDTRRALAHISDRFFDHPSGKIELIGLTGTKGKTTTTYMTRAILAAEGRRVGLIGTISNIIGDQISFASRTTPESYDLQAMLDEMVHRGMDCCVMEVSSQGLMLDRVYGCDFYTGAFMNLYHDHIGPREHADMASYLEAKLRLFTMSQNAVINRDMPQYETVRSAVKSPCLTFGFSEKADVRAVNLRKATQNQRIGTEFELITPWYQGEIFVGMPGRFNVTNALAAIACAGLSGASLSSVRNGLSDISVPGRVQPIPTEQPFQVIVDYAHNAVSLENLLLTLRDYVSGRLIVVFGNGGDRARSRRYEMGEVSGRLADLTVITSDNPRTEDPEAIIRDIITGIEPTGGLYKVIVDRSEAIDWAIRTARAGDMVVIAGKGHENYQIFKDRTIHFDDAETAAACLAALRTVQDA